MLVVEPLSSSLNLTHCGNSNSISDNHSSGRRVSGWAVRDGSRTAGDCTGDGVEDSQGSLFAGVCGVEATAVVEMLGSMLMSGG